MNASLFVTCVVDQFYPEVGESTVRVLRRLGVTVDFPQSQTCCGQPAYNSGFLSDAKPLAHNFLETFENADAIVIPSGSCAAMIRVFYPDLFDDEPKIASRMRELSAKTFEFTEYLVDHLGVSEIPGSGNASSTLSVTYHEGCHLRRELGVTTQPRKLIRALDSVDLLEMGQADVCCGFGGMFSVKYPDISAGMLSDKIRNIDESGANAVVSCDSTCLMQISGGLEQTGMNTRAIHIAQILDEAMQ